MELSDFWWMLVEIVVQGIFVLNSCLWANCLLHLHCRAQPCKWPQTLNSMIWPKIIFSLFQCDDHALCSSVSSSCWALARALCSSLTDIVVCLTDYSVSTKPSCKVLSQDDTYLLVFIYKPLLRYYYFDEFEIDMH